MLVRAEHLSQKRDNVKSQDGARLGQDGSKMDLDAPKS